MIPVRWPMILDQIEAEQFDDDDHPHAGLAHIDRLARMGSITEPPKRERSQRRLGRAIVEVSLAGGFLALLWLALVLAGVE